MDRYTKTVLTIIAVCLLWLCLWGPGPKWGTPVEAQTGTVDVNIAQVDGKRLPRLGSLSGIPVEGTGSPLYPVEVKVK